MVKNGSLSDGYAFALNDNELSDIAIEEMGDQHAATSIETPMKANAFEMSDEEKVEKIAAHFKEIMDILGLDLQDDSLSGTPKRVAKMYVKEIFSGLKPANKPKISLFDNKFKYRQMLVEKNINLQSFCEHHFLPIQGVVHIAYIANKAVIGLSKLNRIVEHYARRPQVQERLTVQIAEALREALNTQDVAVYVEAKHMCVEMRGIEHQGCTTVSTEYSGKFLNENIKAEFLQAIK
ncbi:MAG: GTP cyclohydrolase I FolE [Chitinophagales bacterium]|nr:GTP cyclohydrolase I FolE [Chitinophagales bacterium]